MVAAFCLVGSGLSPANADGDTSSATLPVVVDQPKIAPFETQQADSPLIETFKFGSVVDRMTGLRKRCAELRRTGGYYVWCLGCPGYP